jgi:natural product precursor
MKTSKTKGTSSTSPAKGTSKIKSLKLRKETVETLSDQETQAVKGGAYTNWCHGGGSAKT